MAWEARLIAFLQQDFFNGFMLALTQFGDELFLLLVVAVLYWCVNKRLGYRFLNVYLMGTAVNTGLKSLFRRVRPFNKFPDSITSVGNGETSYSFPSGHSHSIANLSTQAVLVAKKRRRMVVIVGACLTAVVMFSRMYLGQHYLTDVVVGAALGIGTALLFTYLFELLKNREEWLVLGIAPLCIVIAVILCVFRIEIADVFKVIGAFLAFSVGYFFEKRFVRFQPQNDRFYKHVLKLILGLGVALLLKELTKLFLPVSIPLLHDFLRYFLVAAWASVGAPVVFRLCRLSGKSDLQPRLAEFSDQIR